MLSVKNGSGALLTRSAVGNRYLFQGREYSWLTGLYSFRARWYDPVVGRWLSPDPIGVSGGLNQYVFCANNPVNFLDPFGLAAGDPYESADDAATAALTDALPISIKAHREYSGMVYKMPNGKYYYTDPKRGGLRESPTSEKDIPEKDRKGGEECQGQYHTHWEYQDETFSGPDLRIGDETTKLLKRPFYLWLGTPSGSILKYYPGGRNGKYWDNLEQLR